MSRGVLVTGATPGAGATLIAGAITATMRYLHARPVGALRPAAGEPDHAAFDAEHARFGYVVVCVPAGAPAPAAEVAVALDLPVLVVVRDAPGAPEAAQAALASLAAASVRVMGVVLNRAAEGDPGPDAPDHRALLRAQAPDTQVLGIYPHLPPGGPDDPIWMGRVADRLESCVDLFPILEAAAPRR